MSRTSADRIMSLILDWGSAGLRSNRDPLRGGKIRSSCNSFRLNLETSDRQRATNRNSNPLAARHSPLARGAESTNKLLQSQRARLDDAPGFGHELVNAHRALLAAPLPQADAPAAGFLLPDDEHVGDLLELRIADFRSQLLVAAVHFDPQAGLPELGRGVVRVIQKLFRKGQHDSLYRRQPDRKCAGEVLDDDGDEALQRSEDGPMDHDRPMLG